MTDASWPSVLLRVVFAIALVLLTFNPSGYSYYHGASAVPAGVMVLKAFVGAALLIR